jgi:Fe-S cluster biogenesis protein NfuA/nitrite reductase/ring-hydroxylating ferredoxin subunit
LIGPPSVRKARCHLKDREMQARVARVETLLDKVESLSDPNARATAEETVRAVVELYGEGLARIMELVAELGGENTLNALAADDLVSHLLLLHDLHPDDAETRVARALEGVRPYLRSHGGNVEFLGIDEGVARLRLQGSCNGCPSSTMTLKLAIEEAITKVAPDLNGIEAEGVAPSRPSPVTFVPRSRHTPSEQGSWAAVGALPQLASNGLLLREVAGEPVLFLRLGQDYYAYQHRCPACAGSLAEGKLTGTELTCGGCGHAYDIQRAGRCLDAPQLHLEPIPLLVSDSGLVKIAVASEVK